MLTLGKALEQRDTKLAGQVVVARTSENEIGRRVVSQALRRTVRLNHNGQRLEGGCDRCACQPVELVSPYDAHPDQARCKQQLEMIARSLRRDVRQHGQFTRGARFTT